MKPTKILTIVLFFLLVIIPVKSIGRTCWDSYSHEIETCSSDSSTYCSSVQACRDYTYRVSYCSSSGCSYNYNVYSVNNSCSGACESGISSCSLTQACKRYYSYQNAYCSSGSCRYSSYYATDNSCTSLCASGACSGGSCVPACTSHSYKACYFGDSYWYDSCGVREGVYDLCNAFETCENGYCVADCSSHYTKNVMQVILIGMIPVEIEKNYMMIVLLLKNV